MEFKLSKADVYMIREALELLAQRKRDKVDIYREAYGEIDTDEDIECVLRGLEVSIIEIDELAINLMNQIKK